MIDKIIIKLPAMLIGQVLKAEVENLKAEFAHDTNTTMGEIGKWLKHPLEFGNILVNGKKLADTLFALEETPRAPNGQPSNLTVKQWEQVRTPEFKQKFGDWEAAAIQGRINNKNRIEIKEAENEIKSVLDMYYSEPKGWRENIIKWAKDIITEPLEDPEGNTVEFSYIFIIVWQQQMPSV